MVLLSRQGSVCWDITHPAQPETGARTHAGSPNKPGVGTTPTGTPNGPRAGATGPGRPGVEHVDMTPRVQGRHGRSGTAPAPAHRRLKVSNRRHSAGYGEGRTVSPSTYGGGLKVSGRTDPAGPNNTATALWEQLQRHGRRLGSLFSLA